MVPASLRWAGVTVVTAYYRYMLNERPYVW